VKLNNWSKSSKLPWTRR